MLWCPNQHQTYVVGISMHNVVRSCWVACETFLIFYRPTDLINKYASGLYNAIINTHVWGLTIIMQLQYQIATLTYCIKRYHIVSHEFNLNKTHKKPTGIL